MIFMKQDDRDRCKQLANSLPFLYANIGGQTRRFSSPRLDNDIDLFKNLNGRKARCTKF